MKEELDIVRLKSDYCEYLRQYDNKVPYNSNSKKLRPFVEVLFEINDYMYFTSLSNPKSKHLKIKSKVNFLKIDGGKFGTVNFNNMLPVMESNIIRLDFKQKAKKS